MVMGTQMIIWMTQISRIYVIDHIQNNFERFTAREGNSGDIHEVNFEQVAAMLAGYSESFRK